VVGSERDRSYGQEKRGNTCPGKKVRGYSPQKKGRTSYRSEVKGFAGPSAEKKEKEGTLAVVRERGFCGFLSVGGAAICHKGEKKKWRSIRENRWKVTKPTVREKTKTLPMNLELS